MNPECHPHVLMMNLSGFTGTLESAGIKIHSTELLSHSLLIFDALDTYRRDMPYG